MEQIVRNMLKQQGIEIVGVFDKEKDIWVYIKDEEVFFCKGDLSHVDRKKLELAQEVLVLTESDDSVRVISDGEYFTNFIVIDINNKVMLIVYNAINTRRVWETSTAIPPLMKRIE